MMDDRQIVDFRGNIYRVGDTVVYPRMSGRSCELQEAIVVEIKPFNDTRYVENPAFDPNAPSDNYRKVNQRHIPETFINYKVKVLPTRNSRGFYRTGTNSYDQDKEVSPVWIQIKENVMWIANASPETEKIVNDNQRVS